MFKKLFEFLSKIVSHYTRRVLEKKIINQCKIIVIFFYS